MPMRPMTLKGAAMRQPHVMFSLCLGLLLYPALRPCSAATFTCGVSDVACLIATITAANRTPEPDTIRLAGGTYRLTAADNNTSGPNGLPSVTSALTIMGIGTGLTTIQRTASAPLFRLFHVGATGTLTLQDLTVTGGRDRSAGGGGILNEGTLILTSIALTHNDALAGGGLANLGGSVTIEHS